MTKRIPNLWHRDVDEPDRLYALFLCQLMRNDQYERMLEVCRVIRRYARQGPGTKSSLFTFFYDRIALFELQQWKAALRQAKFRDRIVYGHVDYATLQWKPEDGSRLIYELVPIHYHLNQLERACYLMEAGLGVWMSFKKPLSWYWYWSIASQTIHLNHISLACLYRLLKQDLRAWKHWNAFIDGLPSRFYTMVGVTRKQLRENPRLLRQVNPRVRQLQNTEAFQKVVAPEDVRLRKQAESRVDEAENQRRRVAFDQQLKVLFPELRQLND